MNKLLGEETLRLRDMVYWWFSFVSVLRWILTSNTNIATFLHSVICPSISLLFRLACTQCSNLPLNCLIKQPSHLSFSLSLPILTWGHFSFQQGGGAGAPSSSRWEHFPSALVGGPSERVCGAAAVHLWLVSTQWADSSSYLFPLLWAVHKGPLRWL